MARRIRPGEVLRALSVRNPHALRIALGLKTIETRTWPTGYRGDLLIVSSARPRIWPHGRALTVVRLDDCRPMRPPDAGPAGVPYRPGLWAWVLGDNRPLTPFPLKGRLKFFRAELPPGVRFEPDFARHLRRDLFGTIIMPSEAGPGG